MRKVREVPTQFPREEDQVSDYGFSPGAYLVDNYCLARRREPRRRQVGRLSATRKSPMFLRVELPQEKPYGEKGRASFLAEAYGSLCRDSSKIYR